MYITVPCPLAWHGFCMHEKNRCAAAHRFELVLLFHSESVSTPHFYTLFYTYIIPYYACFGKFFYIKMTADFVFVSGLKAAVKTMFLQPLCRFVGIYISFGVTYAV